MNTLKVGDTGADVKTLQTDLQLLGYNIQADGMFGNGTKSIVMQFQRDFGLSPDGVVGNNTWTELQHQVANPQILGIDVSHYNNHINWSVVNKNQVRFVYCKATEGPVVKDDAFDYNMSELTRLNFIRGAYHFLRFKDVTAQDQINNFLNCKVDYSKPGVLPPMVDVEWQGRLPNSPLNLYVVQHRAACAQMLRDVLNGIEKATGKKPIIYTDRHFWVDQLGSPSGFEQYPLWIAYYRTTQPTLPGSWKNYAFWQFSGSGQTDGIPGQVDQDIFNGTLVQLRKMANL
jgi:lysozyme